MKPFAECSIIEMDANVSENRDPKMAIPNIPIVLSVCIIFFEVALKPNVTVKGAT
jgi:hypothetical protein